MEMVRRLCWMNHPHGRQSEFLYEVHIAWEDGGMVELAFV
jgi:hypothetical protein